MKTMKTTNAKSSQTARKYAERKSRVAEKSISAKSKLSPVERILAQEHGNAQHEHQAKKCLMYNAWRLNMQSSEWHQQIAEIRERLERIEKTLEDIKKLKEQSNNDMKYIREKVKAL
jgi:hypothetical protein